MLSVDDYSLLLPELMWIVQWKFPLIQISLYLPARRGGLMVSALDSGSGGLGSNPGWGAALCS